MLYIVDNNVQHLYSPQANTVLNNIHKSILRKNKQKKKTDINIPKVLTEIDKQLPRHTKDGSCHV
jgi:hypothetical protein